MQPKITNKHSLILGLFPACVYYDIFYMFAMVAVIAKARFGLRRKGSQMYIALRKEVFTFGFLSAFRWVGVFKIGERARDYISFAIKSRSRRPLTATRSQQHQQHEYHKFLPTTVFAQIAVCIPTR